MADDKVTPIRKDDSSENFMYKALNGIRKRKRASAAVLGAAVLGYLGAAFTQDWIPFSGPEAAHVHDIRMVQERRDALLEQADDNNYSIVDQFKLEIEDMLYVHGNHNPGSWLGSLDDLLPEGVSLNDLVEEVRAEYETQPAAPVEVPDTSSESGDINTPPTDTTNVQDPTIPEAQTPPAAEPQPEPAEDPIPTEEDPTETLDEQLDRYDVTFIDTNDSTVVMPYAFVDRTEIYVGNEASGILGVRTNGPGTDSLKVREVLPEADRVRTKGIAVNFHVENGLQYINPVELSDELISFELDGQDIKFEGIEGDYDVMPGRVAFTQQDVYSRAVETEDGFMVARGLMTRPSTSAEGETNQLPFDFYFYKAIGEVADDPVESDPITPDPDPTEADPVTQDPAESTVEDLVIGEVDHREIEQPEGDFQVNIYVGDVEAMHELLDFSEVGDRQIFINRDSTEYEVDVVDVSALTEAPDTIPGDTIPGDTIAVDLDSAPLQFYIGGGKHVDINSLTPVEPTSGGWSVFGGVDSHKVDFDAEFWRNSNTPYNAILGSAVVRDVQSDEVHFRADLKFDNLERWEEDEEHPKGGEMVPRMLNNIRIGGLLDRTNSHNERNPVDTRNDMAYLYATTEILDKPNISVEVGPALIYQSLLHTVDVEKLVERGIPRPVAESYRETFLEGRAGGLVALANFEAGLTDSWFLPDLSVDFMGASHTSGHGDGYMFRADVRPTLGLFDIGIPKVGDLRINANGVYTHDDGVLEEGLKRSDFTLGLTGQIRR